MTPLMYFYEAGLSCALNGADLVTLGLDAFPPDEATAMVEYATINKAEILAELHTAEQAYAGLFDLAQHHGLRFWFKKGGRQGAPRYELDQFPFGVVTALWMNASPLQYWRYKELLRASREYRPCQSGVCGWIQAA